MKDKNDETLSNQPEEKKTEIDRRRFLGTAGALAVGTLAGLSGGGAQLLAAGFQGGPRGNLGADPSNNSLRQKRTIVRVTIDIFSGRPNPVWILDEPLAKEVLRQIYAEPGVISPADQDRGVLGFRGLLLEIEGEDKLPWKIRLAGGFSKKESRGLEIAEQLIASLGRATVLPAHGEADRKAFEGLDLVTLVRQELNNVPLDGAAAPVDMSSPSSTAPVQKAANQVGGNNDVIYGWTTYNQGACLYEASGFNPSYWNASYVQPYNNCYNYATNRRTDTFAQPGRATGAGTTTMQCSTVANGAVSDQNLADPTCGASYLAPRDRMALVIWPGVDYHWYRRHNGTGNDEFWGHKPGSTAARNTDNSGRVIYNPETANRGGYTVFCGYFYSPSNVVIQ